MNETEKIPKIDLPVQISIDLEALNQSKRISNKKIGSKVSASKAPPSESIVEAFSNENGSLSLKIKIPAMDDMTRVKSVPGPLAPIPLTKSKSYTPAAVGTRKKALKKGIVERIAGESMTPSHHHHYPT